MKLSKEAKAERFQLMVKAMGGPESYDRYIFAEGLPADLRLGIFYAGPGTLWTDLKGFEQTMLGKLVAGNQNRREYGCQTTCQRERRQQERLSDDRRA